MLTPDAGTDASNSSVEPSPDSNHGDLRGSGSQTEDALGVYELAELNPDAAVATYDVERVGNEVRSLGFSDEQLAAAQAFAMDFVVTQFIDSSALDTGPTGYGGWLVDTAPRYLSAEILADPALQSGASLPVLNTATAPNVPALVRDGTPRASKLDLVLNSVSGDRYNAAPFIDFSIQFAADYRVDDAAATAFAAQLTGMTPAEFLASDRASAQLRDGSGTNTYSASGAVRLGVQPSGDAFVVIGIQSDADFDTSDFTGS
jgi:hypothetical protein